MTGYTLRNDFQPLQGTAEVVNKFVSPTYSKTLSRVTLKAELPTGK